jgi:hypothetical protein
MANPNLFSTTTITGKTAVNTVTTTVGTVVANAGSSGQIYKINSMYVTNNGTTDVTVTVDLRRSNVSYYLVYQVVVPAKSTLIAIGREGSFYLEESDTLRIEGSADNNITAITSYEILTDA